jgi:uncharacterized protein (DUF2147 family)
MFKPFAAALLFAAAPCLALAQPTPVGLWKTIDDETGQAKSHVRIKEVSGVLSGSIEKVLDPAKQDAICDLCKGDRKDKSVTGLTILRNMKQSGDDRMVWEGGDIVDPNNGKVYKARIRPIEEGKKLEMRGYIGPFFKTQIWQRIE